MLSPKNIGPIRDYLLSTEDPNFLRDSEFLSSTSILASLRDGMGSIYFSVYRDLIESGVSGDEAIESLRSELNGEMDVALLSRLMVFNELEAMPLDESVTSVDQQSGSEQPDLEWLNHLIQLRLDGLNGLGAEYTDAQARVYNEIRKLKGYLGRNVMDLQLLDKLFQEVLVSGDQDLMVELLFLLGSFSNRLSWHEDLTYYGKKRAYSFNAYEREIKELVQVLIDSDEMGPTDVRAAIYALQWGVADPRELMKKFLDDNFRVIIDEGSQRDFFFVLKYLCKQEICDDIAKFIFEVFFPLMDQLTEEDLSTLLQACAVFSIDDQRGTKILDELKRIELDPKKIKKYFHDAVYLDHDTDYWRGRFLSDMDAQIPGRRLKELSSGEKQLRDIMEDYLHDRIGIDYLPLLSTHFYSWGYELDILVETRDGVVINGSNKVNIEFDGGGHHLNRDTKDTMRDMILEEHGIQVVRITGSDLSHIKSLGSNSAEAFAFLDQKFRIEQREGMAA